MPSESMTGVWRIRWLQACTLLIFTLISMRLVYWHLFAGPRLLNIAKAQRASQIEIPAARGLILSSDGFPLVSNIPSYLAYAYLPDIADKTAVAQAISPIIFNSLPSTATFAGEVIKDEQHKMTATLLTKLESDTTWVPLARSLNDEHKQAIEALHLKGIGFETSQIRDYPEASMAAHLLGFVGSDGTGTPKGYFGLEGYYNGELAGVPGVVRQEIDLSGKPILTGDFTRVTAKSGRSIVTHLDRSLQLLIENALRQGLSRYQAAAGEVLVMNPHTGAILALAAFPGYEPKNFREYPPEMYRNPAIAESYEPGSTFKVLVMSAAINEKKVTPLTPCDQTCNGPVVIGSYDIRTWNNEYHPGLTMTDVLKYSDNTGMVFVSRALGESAFKTYLQAYGFGQPTGIDVEGEGVPPLRKNWRDIDWATASFGQGIAVTSLQMVAAVSAIANGGTLYTPQVVKSVLEEGVTHEIKPKPVRRVITKETAKTIAAMMEESAAHGEAQWAAIKGYRVAGKTGTAQVPIAGHYDADKTIASFIGFAPAPNPKFVMLVKLREPQSSPWAAETAAPLWFTIARDILRYYNITAE